MNEDGAARDDLTTRARALAEAHAAAARRLNAALGRDLVAPLPPLPELPPLPGELVEEEVATALQGANPELVARAHWVAASRWELRVAEKSRVPDLQVGVEVMGGGEMGRTRVGLLAGMNLPIWQARRQAEVAEAAARLAAVTARQAWPMVVSLRMAHSFAVGLPSMMLARVMSTLGASQTST